MVFQAVSQFTLLALVVIIAGGRLAQSGDLIASSGRLGRTWVGIILIASVTSLPELVNTIGATTYAHSPKIAVGDLLGSNLFNLLIIALLDLYYRGAPVLSKAEQGHILSGTFGISLVAIVAWSLSVKSSQIPSLLNIGLYAPFLIIGYFLAVRMIFRFEKRKLRQFAKEMVVPKPASLKRIYLYYFISAMAIVAAGTWLPVSAVNLAKVTGLTQNFVGTLFVALATSLPELFVALAAVRINAIDMGIGGIFGSNLFNLAILGLADFFYRPGLILAGDSGASLVTAIAVIFMTAVAIASLLYRSEKRIMGRLSWDSATLLTVYLLTLTFTYLLK